MTFLTVDFDRKYKRDSFFCTHESLNNYLKLQATKESKAGLAKVYVYLSNKEEILGYYTLSSAELPKDTIPQSMLKKLPGSYSGYPAILLGRLAVTRQETGKGLGGQLLVDAIHRCLIHAESVGTSVIMVDPIDESAVRFYEKFGFNALPNANSMLLKIDHALKGHFSGK